MLFVFFCFDDSKGQPYSLWVVLAAIAERYSNGILGARCLVAGLNKMVGVALRRPKSKVSATSEAKFEIEMWRVMGLLLWANPTSFSISIEMFTHRYDITKLQSNRNVFTITDASGWRICVALYDTETKFLIAWSSYLFPFKSDPGLYQNNREFLGVIMSLMLFRIKFPCETSSKNADQFQFKWVGDNKSALSWVTKEKCNSLAGQTASMVYTRFQIYSNIYVNEVEHLPGVMMGDIDHNSRDNPAPSLIPSLYVSLDTIPAFASIIKLLDPSINRNLQQHHTAFINIHELLSVLLNYNQQHI